MNDGLTDSGVGCRKDDRLIGCLSADWVNYLLGFSCVGSQHLTNEADWSMFLIPEKRKKNTHTQVRAHAHLKLFLSLSHKERERGQVGYITGKKVFKKNLNNG